MGGNESKDVEEPERTEPFGSELFTFVRGRGDELSVQLVKPVVKVKELTRLVGKVVVLSDDVIDDYGISQLLQDILEPICKEKARELVKISYELPSSKA